MHTIVLSIGTRVFSPFEIVIDFKYKQPIDLVLMAHHHSRVSDSSSAFASHKRALHDKKIKDEMMKNNANHKTSTDLHYKLTIFNVRDYVMVRLRPERFPPKTMKKLHVRSARPL